MNMEHTASQKRQNVTTVLLLLSQTV